MNIESIIDDLSKEFVNKAINKYKYNDYLYLTKDFRKNNI